MSRASIRWAWSTGWLRHLRAVAGFVLAAASLPAMAGELAIIVNPDSGVERLSRSEVVNIFMGRQQKLPSGIPVMAMDLGGGHEEKRLFYARLVGKAPAEISAYWARLMFSGQGVPPRQVDSVEEMLDMVATHKGAIGYVERDRLIPRVKAVLTLADQP